MKSQKLNYSNCEKNLKKDEEMLDLIFKKLTQNREEEKWLKKLDQLIKSKIDIQSLLPSSKSFEGENLLTLSKLWMILILIKITRGSKQKEEFLTLVNSSLTHDLNEYEEYRQFFEDQCEQLFSDQEAIIRINKNPKMEKKLEKPSKHEEVRANYIYLLFKPDYFKKVKYQGISKIKKMGENRGKSKSRTTFKSKTNLSDISNTLDEDEMEKGDRLNEDDMITKKNELKKRKKSKTASYKKGKDEEEKEKEEQPSENKKKKGRPKRNKEMEKEKDKENTKQKNNYNKKKKKESEDESIDKEEIKNKKDQKPKKGRPPKVLKGREKKIAEDIKNLLGLDQDDSESKNEKKRSKKSESVPPQKKKKEILNEEKKKKSSKSIIKKKKKIEEEEEEEEDEFDETSSNLSIFDENKYGDDLSKFNEDEKKQMEKEIKAALEGKMDELDMDILEGSKIEGISLEQFKSESSDMDLD